MIDPSLPYLLKSLWRYFASQMNVFFLKNLSQRSKNWQDRANELWYS